MNSRPTPLQANYPVPEDFVAMARRWRPDAIEIMMGYVWQGFDTLLEKENFELGKAEESLERDISFVVCQKIRDAIDGKPPYYLEHLPPENERRVSAQAAPPTPDLGFVWIHNPRAIFPLEAKILSTDRKVGKYVKEIKDNFLTGRYASFSSEAAMLGYLLKGKAERAFENISSRLNCTLKRYPPYQKRNHRFSRHRRNENGTGSSRKDFMCHHIIILFGLSIR
jgi:hypothetical protein